MDSLINELIIAAQRDAIQKISVGAAVVHDGKILIMQRRADDFMPNIFELPGGACEGNETLIDAVYREVLEESQCSIERIIRYIGYIDFPSASGKATRRFNFLVKVHEPVMVVLSEHADYRWITPQEAQNYPITAQTRGIIAQITNEDLNS